MATSDFLPALPAEFEPTRATLHAYARAIGALQRAHGVPHPKWWHLGLKLRPEGLAADPLPLPQGGTVGLTMDPSHHEIVFRASTGEVRRFDMRLGATGSEMGDALIAAAAEYGLEGGGERDRFADEGPRTYDPSAALAFFRAFTNIGTVFARHRITLGERVGPIQVWPHGFDLSFEWFGTRTQPHAGEEMAAQLNLGFFPAGDAYFYSNPWPFTPSLFETPLPHGAQWTTEGFEGSFLPYATLQGDPAAAAKLSDYARAVFEAAAPTLEGS